MTVVAKQANTEGQDAVIDSGEEWAQAPKISTPNCKSPVFTQAKT